MRYKVWGLALVIIAFGASFYVAMRPGEAAVPIKPVVASVTGDEVSKLTGLKLNRNTFADQPIAVVIENYTPIRHQQAGLEEAAIVYETLAEGGITRLLAIYTGEPADLIGPVRSARPYFNSWASEYRAAYLHVGGSPDALENLKSNSYVLNIDEFAGHKVIWRSKRHSMPHNAYTSVDNALSFMKKADYKAELTGPRFLFKEPDAEPGVIKTIQIEFKHDPYKVKYVYDASKNSYERFNGGVKHHNIQPTNVLIQFTEQEEVDQKLRRSIQARGTGEALLFRDGKRIKGTWQKLNTGFTLFLDENGQEMELNPGQTWIEVLPNGMTVNYF